MIQQLMFGQGGFNAQTETGQFVYYPNPHGQGGSLTTLNYSAATMTTWFNNRSLTINSMPQAAYGTLTVNFNFTVPSGYTLYLVVRMSEQMNSAYSKVYLNGSSTAFKTGHTFWNFPVANANDSITEMKFEGSVAGQSSYNDGYVAKVGNFVLVPTGSSVNSGWATEAEFTSNIPGAIITGV